MKITREGLTLLIAEVLNSSRRALLEHEAIPQLGPDSPSDGDGIEPKAKLLVKQQLFHLARKADQLHDILGDSEDLPAEDKDHLVSAIDHIGSVFEKIMYMKQNPEGR